MKKGKKLEKRITHRLARDEIISIYATADFFQPCDNFLGQMRFDLMVAKYKIYDWIAMLLNGRHKGYGEGSIDLAHQQYITRVMVDAYLMPEVKSAKDFVGVLRWKDYQVSEPIPITWSSWSGYEEEVKR